MRSASSSRRSEGRLASASGQPGSVSLALTTVPGSVSVHARTWPVARTSASDNRGVSGITAGRPPVRSSLTTVNPEGTGSLTV